MYIDGSLVLLDTALKWGRKRKKKEAVVVAAAE